jgi:hypothetical protein
MKNRDTGIHHHQNQTVSLHHHQSQMANTSASVKGTEQHVITQIQEVANF